MLTISVPGHAHLSLSLCSPHSRLEVSGPLLSLLCPALSLLRYPPALPQLSSLLPQLSLRISKVGLREGGREEGREEERERGRKCEWKGVKEEGRKRERVSPKSFLQTPNTAENECPRLTLHWSSWVACSLICWAWSLAPDASLWLAVSSSTSSSFTRLSLATTSACRSWRPRRGRRRRNERQCIL